jgi:predicted HNH restriction endonuclease
MEHITPAEDDALASLPKNKYTEARRMLVRHKWLERALVRNRKLVDDAKKYFKAKHGKLFCESCEFDFHLRYGVRGLDYIEAHHSTPIARIKAGTQLRVTDLKMVCANCHRMLHRPPWITLRQLKKEMAGART